MQKIWEIFPRLTERIWQDHADAGMLGGHHDPEHAIRVGQMAVEISREKIGYEWLSGAAGLCHNADRILQKRLGIGRREVPENAIRNLVREELLSEGERLLPHEEVIVEAVLKHDGKNSGHDSTVLVALMDADRLVNAEPDLVIRSGQFLHDLPAVDPVHLWSDPDANYRDPRSVLRDVMETIVWLTPGDSNPFYVRLPKSREIAARRKVFFDNFAETLVACRKESGFYPYPAELLELRNRFLTSEK